MDIYLNGSQTSVPDQLKLQVLLGEQRLSEMKGIAVAVNNKVIIKSLWPEYTLREQDKILVIKASQGG